jgi:type II secretory pathway pseudopilin PulG
MTVVAIIGVLSAMGVSSLVEMSRWGRVNGAATIFSRMLYNARSRSIAERCKYLVQITGPGWSPAAAAGTTVIPLSVITFRKANCTSLNGFFEVGDQQISSYIMDAETKVTMGTIPLGIIPGDVMGANAITFSWTNLGVREIYVDTTNSATWAQDTTATGDFNFTMLPWGTPVPPTPKDIQRTLQIPIAAGAKAP